MHFSGLAIGERYRMEMTLDERLADGTCMPTDVRASVEFEPMAAAGMVEVRGAELPGPGVFVAFEHLMLGDTEVAAHDDCDDVAQTLRVDSTCRTHTDHDIDLDTDHGHDTDLLRTHDDPLHDHDRTRRHATRAESAASDRD